ncbi:TlpA disulfide reductase family protein [Marinobacterium sediminicola]|uniref:Thiol-disulfide isomerase or thioredoxin n=1 Tax=Marinobacterium sediminicola TaxID=518898 RepID=A0ABY1S0R9_9GAMM|nr:TlpA disulfide reductase family protein [Marinobacterium sediminicola]ULG69615.1 TlpA family protein disulfide reductase [Marinobacterium sediminicola]SMR74657.1 Thiol-disulfide isomerase or thioredoxin [Marinobacterium sediminicola]
MQSLALGPFALSIDRLLILLAIAVALFAGWISSRRDGRNPEAALITIVLIGILGARLGFVLRYHEDYLADPLQIIDIRDGGFWWVSGLACGLTVALTYLWRQPDIRRSLGIALATGTLVWGSIALPLAQLQNSTRGLPEMTLMTAAGEAVNLRDYAGQPIVLNVWASWCPPCVREMPVLEEAQHRYPGVQFLFANLGEDPATVEAFLSQLDVDLQHVLLDQHNQLGQHYGSRGLPTTLFIDADGQLKDTHLGELSVASLKGRLGSILPGQLPQ